MPTPTWTGRYLDGQNAANRRVTAELTSDGLVIRQGDGSSIRWNYDQIHRTQGAYDGEQIRLEYGADPVTALVIPDQRFLSALRAKAPGLVPVIHDPAKRALRIKLTIMAAVITVLAAGVLYHWGIPGLASVLTPYVPIAWEQHLGERVVAHLAPEDERCTDPYRSQAIQSLLTRLTATVSDSPYSTIRFHIVDDPMVNALAAPGGHIVVFRGLLEKTESPEQLAGVLAHELQHIYKRHTTRAILEQTSTSLLLAAVSGDFTGAATVALDSARTLGALQYSRSHESEADAEGFAMLIAAGIDPQGMVEFFQLMSNDSHPDEGFFRYVSTHPTHRARIDHLTQLGGAALGKGAPLLPGLDWKFIRRICRVTPQQPAESSSVEPNSAPNIRS